MQNEYEGDISADKESVNADTYAGQANANQFGMNNQQANFGTPKPDTYTPPPQPAPTVPFPDWESIATPSSQYRMFRADKYYIRVEIKGEEYQYSYWYYPSAVTIPAELLPLENKWTGFKPDTVAPRNAADAKTKKVTFDKLDQAHRGALNRKAELTGTKPKFHIIRKQETLATIGKKYGIDKEASYGDRRGSILSLWNAKVLRKPDGSRMDINELLDDYAGQRIWIQDPKEFTAQKNAETANKGVSNIQLGTVTVKPTDATNDKGNKKSKQPQSYKELDEYKKQFHVPEHFTYQETYEYWREKLLLDWAQQNADIVIYDLNSDGELIDFRSTEWEWYKTTPNYRKDQEMIGQHLMNFGRFYEMMAADLGFTFMPPPPVRFRPRPNKFTNAKQQYGDKTIKRIKQKLKKEQSLTIEEQQIVKGEKTPQADDAANLKSSVTSKPKNKAATTKNKASKEQPQANADQPTGVFNRGELKKITFEDFASSVDAFKDASKKDIAKEAHELWQAERYEELYGLFQKEGIKWPPMQGGKNIRSAVPFQKGQKFDRYGFQLPELTENGNTNLGGGYTSPMDNGKSFDFEARALDKSKAEYDFYYEIEVLKDNPTVEVGNVHTQLTSEYADIIPWFNQKGGGTQNFWNNIPINPKSAKGYSYSLSELAEMGLIKITIKDSPSGKFQHLINTTIP